MTSRLTSSIPGHGTGLAERWLTCGAAAKVNNGIFPGWAYAVLSAARASSLGTRDVGERGSAAGAASTGAELVADEIAVCIEYLTVAGPLSGFTGAGPRACALGSAALVGHGAAVPCP